jgi:hypothetical protein
MTSMNYPTRQASESRVDSVGWGLFFVMSGAMLLVPGLPDGSWLTGVGVLLLGLSVARVALGLPVSTFGVMLAAVLVATGVGAIVGIAVPWFSILLVGCGVALVVGETIRRNRAA